MAMAVFPAGQLVDSGSRIPLRFCISSIRTAAAAFSALASGPGRTTTTAWLRSMVPEKDDGAQTGRRRANEKRRLIRVDKIIKHHLGFAFISVARPGPSQASEYWPCDPDVFPLA